MPAQIRLAYLDDNLPPNAVSMNAYKVRADNGIVHWREIFMMALTHATTLGHFTMTLDGRCEMSTLIGMQQAILGFST